MSYRGPMDTLIALLTFVALLLGVGGGIAVWVLLNGGNPLA